MKAILAAVVLLGVVDRRSWSLQLGRRRLLHSLASSMIVSNGGAGVGFRYSDEWTGTNLPLLDLQDAAVMKTWDMARWPDPILRRPAELVADCWFGTTELQDVCRLLKQTCTQNHAVGLAAQQCGVNARVVYLINYPVFVNPRIIQRSAEIDMRVWNERCLVLPPDFRATVLRDSWVMVEYQNAAGDIHVKKLTGEPARAMQHELDHDRGILITDHVDLSNMDSIMREIETPGHEQRMELAYARYNG